MKTNRHQKLNKLKVKTLKIHITHLQLASSLQHLLAYPLVPAPWNPRPIPSSAQTNHRPSLRSRKLPQAIAKPNIKLFGFTNIRNNLTLEIYGKPSFGIFRSMCVNFWCWRLWHVSKFTNFPMCILTNFLIRSCGIL